jgi:hypothetical protein
MPIKSRFIPFFLYKREIIDDERNVDANLFSLFGINTFSPILNWPNRSKCSKGEILNFNKEKRCFSKEKYFPTGKSWKFFRIGTTSVGTIFPLLE